MITKILFENKFTPLAQINPVDLIQLGGDVFIKNGSEKQVESLSGFHKIFDQIKPFLKTSHKFTSFDVKLKNVVKGVYPSIAGWHCDGRFAASTKGLTLDRYLILVNDPNCLTEFLNEPVELELNSDLSIPSQMKSFQDQIRTKKVSSKKIEPWTLVEYNSNSFHTVTKPLSDHRRLLIRCNESDYIRPQVNLKKEIS